MKDLEKTLEPGVFMLRYGLVNPNLRHLYIQMLGQKATIQDCASDEVIDESLRVLKKEHPQHVESADLIRRHYDRHTGFVEFGVQPTTDADTPVGFQIIATTLGGILVAQATVSPETVAEGDFTFEVDNTIYDAHLGSDFFVPNAKPFSESASHNNGSIR